MFELCLAVVRFGAVFGAIRNRNDNGILLDFYANERGIVPAVIAFACRIALQKGIQGH